MSDIVAMGWNERNCKEELRRMMVSISPYAPWQIFPLERIFRRYEAMLTMVSGLRRYNQLCSTLRRTIPALASFIAETITSANVSAYNRASTELTWDIECLIEIIDAT